MNINIIDKIKYIRCAQLIEDPFPKLTEKRRFMTWLGKKKFKEEINPWEAYQKGYNKAYKEIINYFKKNKENYDVIKKY